VIGIQRRTIRLPEDLYALLQALAYLTGEGEHRLAARAVQAYLDGEGHDVLVAGFGERARSQHRVALDRLHDP
jgi:predicted transcriptional regulator